VTISYTTLALTTEEKLAIFHLWNSEYPIQLAYKDVSEIEGYLEGLPNQRHYFAIDPADAIVGWAFVFDRDNERWFAIIVKSHFHKKGIGSQLLGRLKEDEKTLSGWVTDHSSYVLKSGAPYISPIDFYVKNGFVVCKETRLEIDVLSAVKIQWADGATPLPAKTEP
jgi:GNAT superfamily N-acetyltransferase